MARDYEAVDHAAVVRVLRAGSYTANSSNFLGLFEAHNPPPDGDLSPSRPPKIFALWQLETQDIEEVFSDVRPVIEYALVVETHRQAGAGMGYVHQLVEEIRDALKAGHDNTDGLAIQYKQGQPLPIGKVGNFMLTQSTWPVHGGAN